MGQVDTISSYNIKTKFDSISNQILYYEQLNNNQTNYFKKYKLIENKIIESENSYKYIKNGRLKKVVQIDKMDILKKTKLYDDTGNIEIIIKCDKYGIKSIDKYKNGKVIISYDYGLKDSIIKEYFYTNLGVQLRITKKNETSIYNITLDSITQEVLSKTLIKKIEKELKPDLEEDLSGDLYFTHRESISSEIYNQFAKYCE